jgi:hypothetical protein
MGITFPTYPEYPLPPLFPQWESPNNGPQPAVYAWRAWTNPSTVISSSVVTPRPLSDIPSSVLALIWYASPPGYPERKTMDYGKGAGATPYTFQLPDGSNRVNTSNLSQTAFNQLVGNIWADMPYPP